MFCIQKFKTVPYRICALTGNSVKVFFSCASALVLCLNYFKSDGFGFLICLSRNVRILKENLLLKLELTNAMIVVFRLLRIQLNKLGLVVTRIK